MTENTPHTRAELRATLDENGNPTLKPTAKVLTSGVVMGALVVLVAMLTAITPDLLNFAGPWAPVLFAGIVALAGFIGAYIKKP